MLAIGIDLGGSNLRGAIYRGLDKLIERRRQGMALAFEDWQPLACHKEQVLEPRDPETIVGKLVTLVGRLCDEARVNGSTVPIGLGFAGMLRGYDGVVAKSPYMRWDNVPLGEMLRDRLGTKRPLLIENDVNAIAFGEYSIGSAVGARGVLAVFLGTGIGGGVIAGGRLVESASNCAGELGHMKVVYDASARRCACGSAGCVEAYVGGENLAARAREDLGGGERTSLAVKLAGSVENVHAGHLEEAAAQGDEYAQGLWAEVGPLLGVTIANAVTLLNPSHVVLGGGVLGRTPVLKTFVTAAFEVAVNPPARESVEIVDALLGDDAGLVGSALLALQHRHGK